MAPATQGIPQAVRLTLSRMAGTRTGLFAQEGATVTYTTDPLPAALLPKIPPGQASPPRPAAPSPAARLLDRCHFVDDAVSHALRPISLPALRVMLGVLFLWFGVLKVIGSSPVAALIEQTLPFWHGPTVLLVLGGGEVVVCLLLISGWLVRLSLFALVAHLSGTLSTFVMAPSLMFTDANVFLLTTEGEFVAQNVALIAGALVLLAHSRPAQGERPESPWSTWTCDEGEPQTLLTRGSQPHQPQGARRTQPMALSSTDLAQALAFNGGPP